MSAGSAASTESFGNVVAVSRTSKEGRTTWALRLAQERLGSTTSIPEHEEHPDKMLTPGLLQSQPGMAATERLGHIQFMASMEK